MAASVISNTSSHFSPGSEGYSTNSNVMYQPGFSSRMHEFFYHPPYADRSDYDAFSADGQQNYIYNAEQTPMQYSSNDNWANQANALRRVSSRSPSMQHDRTPIRHHKAGMSRSRSASKSEALLAYATEQSVTSQPHSTTTTPSLPQTTPVSSPGLFQSHSYTSSAMPSPYATQSTYYDSASPQFPEMHNHTTAHTVSDYLSPNRTGLQMQPMMGTNLSPHEAMYLPAQAAVRAPQMTGLQPAPMGFAPMSRPLESTAGGIEVTSSRNKPQCWDHGCNGRQFSTFSNLLRHQREKSGTAAKAKCPHCGTEFTRTTARNGHMYGGKCKGLPDSGEHRSPGSLDGHSDVEAQHLG